jgi:dTDP-4-dehydrorhamnose reductase
MNIVITGAKGGLGNAILSAWGWLVPEWHCDGLSRADAEMTNPEETVKAIVSKKPDVIIHCAAMTAVDKCEEEAELATAINVEGTRAVAQAAKKTRARLVYISTDYVFDGNKGSPYTTYDIPAPLNVYGKTKLEGEKISLKIPRSLIVRTSWLFNKRGKSFPSTILNLAKTKNELKVVSDQIGSPTYSADLAVAILRLVVNKGAGIYHVSNSGSCSWHEFAVAALELKRFEGVKVIPIFSADLPSKAMRPADSRLDCGLYDRKAGKPMRNWKDALADYLKKMRI